MCAFIGSTVLIFGYFWDCEVNFRFFHVLSSHHVDTGANPTRLVVFSDIYRYLSNPRQLALAQRLQSSTSSVSRLDRPTSGVLTVVVGSKMAATTKWRHG